jgi:hypothetical protein
MGHRFEKAISIEMEKPKENELTKIIKQINDPVLNKMDSDKNVCFCLLQGDELEISEVAPIISNILAVNKVMINAPVFDPNILSNLYMTLHNESLLPFKLTEYTL